MDRFSIWLAVLFVSSLPTFVSHSRAQDASSSALRRDLAKLKANPPKGVETGTLDSIGYLLDVADRIQRGYPTQSTAWRNRAGRFLAAAQHGKNPYAEERGRIVTRGYWSTASTVRQGYSLYLPKNYDPARKYPLMIVLHGGSSNGNLFLGVVLGNNMNWLTYPKHLWDEYEPRWHPEWIVVAPDGYGQVMWRWMGEKDVLDVLDDVQKHYQVDADRVVLCGLSNGGVGAYSIGMRNAWRFSSVMALAGAPGWLQYTGGAPSKNETVVMRAVSGYDLGANAFNTDFRMYHGRVDPGPMKPKFVTDFDEQLTRTGIPHKMTWYDAGHDILYMVHKHGGIYDKLANVKRDPRPKEVRLVSYDYRAARQHWVTVTRFSKYPDLAKVHALVEGSTLTVTTENVLGLSLDLRQAPLPQGDTRLVVDGKPVTTIAKGAAKPIDLARDENGAFHVGPPADPQNKLVKRPNLSGPLMDAYYDRTVHVYGTASPEDEKALKEAAERGSRGWPLWLWNYQQAVVADKDVTPELMRSANLVLYATPGSNRVLERIKDKLPIRVEPNGIRVGSRLYEGADIGTRFIYPNPESSNRYVTVQAAPTTSAVQKGHNLPDFLPDYVVYDKKATRSRARLIAGGNKPLTAGFFDRFWQLPSDQHTANSRAEGVNGALAAGAEPSRQTESQEEANEREKPSTLERVATVLPVPVAPPIPSPPRRFLADARDPAGAVARKLARRIASFRNYRAEIPGATWKVDEQALWSIRPQRACLQTLKEAGVPAELVKEPLETPIATPVRLVGPVKGISFRSLHEERDVVIACEMAARLPVLADVLRPYDVTAIGVLSSYRPTPYTSFHTLGLALDVASFATKRGNLSVLRDFIETPTFETCKAPRAGDWKAKALLEIACGLFESKHFSSVLTPNYNAGHRNHFHIDARPDDPRLFLR